MEKEMKKSLKQASELWAAGEALRAGQLIFENLPVSDQPAWAAIVLKLVVDRSGIHSPEIAQVLIAAADPEMWRLGHQLFDALRNTTLVLQEPRKTRELTHDEDVHASIVMLAELVAKVMYNATNPQDAFDEDSGWWVADNLKWFVDHAWRDESFAHSAWLTLAHANLHEGQ
jgi:hypothetical protein